MYDANTHQDVDIYARVEYENISGYSYGSWDAMWHEGSADVVVKFYSDNTCTTHYTLTAALTVYVYWRYEPTYDYGEPDGAMSDHFTITASAGYNYVSLDNRALYAYYDTYDSYSGYHTLHNDHYYDVEDPGDGSYTQLESYGRVFTP